MMKKASAFVIAQTDDVDNTSSFESKGAKAS
jgi:hypothetical protein